MSGTKGTDGLSRRTVVKAAAWSIPVMAIGVPAHAQTGSPPVTVGVGSACKIPGQTWKDLGYCKGYVFALDFTNVNITPNASVKVINVTVDGTDQRYIGEVNLGECPTTGCEDFTGKDCDGNNGQPAGCVPALGIGKTYRILAYTNGETDSNTAKVTVTYEIYDNATCTGTPVLTVTSPEFEKASTPPWSKGGGSCPIEDQCATGPLPAPQDLSGCASPGAP